jgi:hypothetical protein
MAGGTENYLSSFFSTLAQVTATLLSLLAAASGAYFVFLQERVSQHEEVVEQDKLEIRDLVLNLQRSWPQGLGFFLPATFEDEYRKIHPNLGLASLTSEAAADFTFHPETIDVIYKRLESNDYRPGKYKGRVYLWILDKAVKVIANAPSTAGPGADKVYPSRAGAHGFEDWRRNFEALQMTMVMLQNRPDAAADLNEWINSMPPNKQLPDLLTLAMTSVNNVFSVTNQIKQKLLHLDQEQLLATRFEPERKLHPKSLLFLGAASAIIGIFIPLVGLALGIQVTRWASITLLISSTVLSTGSLGHFIYHIARPPRTDWQAYFSQRWYEPMGAWLNQEKTKARDGGEINIDFFVDATSSQDFSKFPKDIQNNITEFIKTARTYNEAAASANEAALALLRKHLGPTEKSLHAGIAQIICLTDLLDDHRFDGVMLAIRKNHPAMVTYEVFHQRFTIEALRIRTDATADPAALLTAKLHPVRAGLAGQRTVLEFDNKRRDIEKQLDRLAAELKTESTSR